MTELFETSLICVLDYSKELGLYIRISFYTRSLYYREMSQFQHLQISLSYVHLAFPLALLQLSIRIFFEINIDSSICVMGMKYLVSNLHGIKYNVNRYITK